MNRRAAIGMLLSALGAVSPAAADEVSDFYHGKTIRLVIGSGTGDSFDLYGRLVARYMGAHIPGQPSIVVQNMPGAGSLNAFSHVMIAAPRDGTTIGLINPASTLLPLLQPGLVKFDMRGVDWIGSLASDYYTCGLWTKEKLSLADLRTREFVMGSTATNSATYAGNMVFKNALKLNFKVVAGYANMAGLNHAAEKGEVQGHCGVMATSLKSTLWPIYSGGALQIPVRATLAPDPDLKDIPNAFDLVSSEEDRQVLLLLAGPWSYGRPLLSAPEVPKPRLAALRAAFEAMVRDPAFLRSAQEQRSEIKPLSGSQVADTVRRMHDIPAAVIERARPMFGVTER